MWNAKGNTDLLVNNVADFDRPPSGAGWPPTA